MSYIIGNWDISGLWSFYGGLRYNPVNGTANVSGSQYPASPTWERPNLVGTPNLPSDQRTIDHWFNTAPFVQPAAGTFGNAGAYLIDGPGTQVVDFGIHRNFPIREKITMSLRLEMFNAFNHPNFTFNPTGAGVVPPAEPGLSSGLAPPLRRMVHLLQLPPVSLSHVFMFEGGRSAGHMWFIRGQEVSGWFLVVRGLPSMATCALRRTDNWD